MRSGIVSRKSSHLLQAVPVGEIDTDVRMEDKLKESRETLSRRAGKDLLDWPSGRLYVSVRAGKKKKKHAILNSTLPLEKWLGLKRRCIYGRTRYGRRNITANYHENLSVLISQQGRGRLFFLNRSNSFERADRLD